MPVLKGPVFPSYLNQNTVQKPKAQWTRHQSTKQQLRHLRQRCGYLLDSKDPETIEVGDRVIRSVCEEPHPEYSALHLFNAGLELAEETGISWIMAMTYLMDRFDGRVVNLDTGEWICGCGETCGVTRLVCEKCGMHRDSTQPYSESAVN